MRGKVLFALLLLAGSAQAQNAIRQTGPVSAGDVATFASDHAAASGNSRLTQTGRGLNPITITDDNGSGVCSNNAATTGTYKAFCMGHDSSGNPNFSIDGTSYPFSPTATGNVTGPGSSTQNDLACWNSSIGTFLKGCVGPNNAPAAAGAQTSITGSSTATWTGGINNYDIFRVLSIFDNSSTNSITEENGIGVYLRNQKQSSGSGQFVPAAVGVNAVTTCEVANCNTFGADFLAQDHAPGTSTSSFVNGVIHGVELDINVGNPNTVATGLTVAGASTVQGVQMEAVYVNSPSVQSVGTVKWNDAFRADDDCCTTSFLVGAQNLAGANINSQGIIFRTYNGSSALKTFELQGRVAANIPSFDLTSEYANFSLGIGISTPVDNTGTGYTGTSINGTVGGALSLQGAGTEYARFTGAAAGTTLAALGSSPFALQTGGINVITATAAGDGVGLPVAVTLGAGTTTGTPVASLCLTAGGVIIKKTTTGPCV